ncbi:hypothetical protein TNCV_4899511 [Trichonephila clavipes]|nr:hypothetical protein TNCV_4899511 [Trichonephila clavipes]
MNLWLVSVESWVRFVRPLKFYHVAELMCVKSVETLKSSEWCGSGDRQGLPLVIVTFPVVDFEAQDWLENKANYFSVDWTVPKGVQRLICPGT